MGQYTRVVEYILLCWKSLPRTKTNLYGPSVRHEENEVLWIRSLYYTILRTFRWGFVNTHPVEASTETHFYIRKADYSLARFVGWLCRSRLDFMHLRCFFFNVRSFPLCKSFEAFFIFFDLTWIDWNFCKGIHNTSVSSGLLNGPNKLECYIKLARKAWHAQIL